MKKITLSLFSVGAFYLLTGFGGVMEVSEPLNFNARKGRNDVSEGTYQVELTRKNKNRLRLLIAAEEKKNDTETDILFPEGKNLDQLDGVFTLTPAEAGQKYFIVGDYSVAREQTGPKQWGQQECSIQVRERYCWIDPDGFRRCGDRWVTKFGYQNITFVMVNLTEEYNFTFKKDETSDAAAALTAENKSVKKDILEQSDCFVR